ncbi:outer membrane protein (porin) [Caballeronia calidae]|uniref:Outer membrane protein (Porin) n=1 Tax=Caballeronia calidae TaxID=1777139 RepID=A0A158EGC8_9BURK|nr:porin [Caballeronia calidae]SAL05760.1 outer membrane protein (porin) [Caballeronia calidae]
MTLNIRILSASVVLSLLPVVCAAQTSITLYGIADESVRYQTNSTKDGGASLNLGTGGASESRWGLTGAENITSNISAIFKIENRFFINNGESDPTIPFFNQAYVGLKSEQLGTLALGRQYSPLIEGMTIGGYGSNSWIPYNYSFSPEVSMAGSVWASNQIKYTARLNDLFVSIGYAFGGVAGHFNYGQQIGAAAAYIPRTIPITLGAAYQRATDTLNGSTTMQWTIGGSYKFDSTKISIGYIENKSDSDFGTFENGPYTAAELTALKYTDFSRRKMLFFGGSEEVTPYLKIFGNAWRTIQLGKSRSDDGSAWQFELGTDYSLAKTTDLYCEIDWSHYRGDLIGAQLQGVNAIGLAQKAVQLGVMTGIRHVF